MRIAVRSVLLGAALAAGCITTPVTTLEVSWVTPQLPQMPFKKLLIITVASDEFVQVAFQDQMAARSDRGVGGNPLRPAPAEQRDHAVLVGTAYQLVLGHRHHHYALEGLADVVGIALLRYQPAGGAAREQRERGEPGAENARAALPDVPHCGLIKPILFKISVSSLYSFHRSARSGSPAR